MVASLLELNHSRATEAALPAFLLSNLNEYLGDGVLRTFSRRVHFIVANTADPCSASLAPSYLTSILESDMIGFDPFATVTSRTVDAISCCVFLEFSVPGLFELLIEQLIDVFERNVLRRAAFWRHVGWISDRHGKNASQTVMAHPMCTCEFGGLDDRYIVRTMLDRSLSSDLFE